MSGLITSTHMSWRYAPVDFDTTNASEMRRFIVDFVDDYCDRVWEVHDEDPDVEFGSPVFTLNVNDEDGRLCIVVGISSHIADIASNPEYTVQSWRLSIGDHYNLGATASVSLAGVVDFIGSAELESMIASPVAIDQILTEITARRAAEGSA